MAGKVNNDIKRIKLIDPNDFTNQYAGNSFSDNKFNMSVPPEDLGIVVELSTYAKGRSILISSQNNGTTTVTNKRINTKFNNNEVINLMTFSNDSTTGNQPNLTTHYTDLSSQLDTIDEALGLTSIDIDFNSSYTPMVNINFIDVRGGALFQQGGSSKYSVFFKLPYPLFQLKIKGYYGKPVVYCLHLTKINSRFNSQTGNFEIAANFVGYTYALLSDMIIGYLKAAGETKRGKELLAARGIPSINSFLQKISKIDDAIKGQLSNTNADAVTLALYQQSETLINNLISDVDKYVSSMQTTYGSKNLLASSKDNKDVLVVNSNDNKIIAGELSTSVNDFNKNFIANVTNYNKLTNNTTLSLMADLSPVFFYTTKATMTVPVINETKKALQNKYSKYNIDDEFKTDNLIKRLHDSITITSNNTVHIIDFTDVLAVLNNQLAILSEQEKKIENALGEQLYGKIKTILQFDPNIRNITNLFTTHIEVLLQLIFETSGKWKEPSRLSQLSKFKEGTIDIKKNDIEKNNIFPWPEYQEKGVEKYLGYPGVLTNPEQVPEIQLVDELFNGMLVSDTVLKNLDNLNGTGPSAWYAMNPVDTYKYQQTKPYDRLPTSSVPNDIAAYMLMRASGYMGFSNAYLTDDEIKAFATAEASAIITKYGNNSSIINALYENYKTAADYVNKVTVIVNGTTPRPALIIAKNDLHEDQAYEYTAIQEINTDANKKVSVIKSLLPTDRNFFGEGVNYKPNTKANVNTEDSKYLLSSINCVKSDINAADNAFYVDFISKSDYETPSVTPATTYTSNAIKFTSINSNLYGDIPNQLKEAGFNTGSGKYGIQDMVQIDYAGTADSTGLNDIQPMYSIFYNNSSNQTLLLTSGRTTTTKLYTNQDLYLKNNVNNFKISETNPIINLFSNYTLSKGNLSFFESKDNLTNVAFPFFGMSVSYTRDGNNYTTFQNLFGSRLYNTQTNSYSKAYLFLHSFPWRGLVGINKSDVVSTSVAYAVELDASGFFGGLAAIIVNGTNKILPDSTVDFAGPFTDIMLDNLFGYRAGFIQVPKLFPAFIGAIIWRYEKGGVKPDGKKFGSLLNFDPTDQTSGEPIIFSNTNTPKTYQYYLSKKVNPFQYSMSFNDTGSYYDVENIILDLPHAAKQRFLNEFYDFVNSNNDHQIDGFVDIQNKFELVPVLSSQNWDAAYKGVVSKEKDGTNNINNVLTYIAPHSTNGDAKTFVKDNYNVLSYFNMFPNNYLIEYKQNGELDNTLKRLFFDYKYFANFSWRLWNKAPNAYRNAVNTQLLLDNCDPKVYLKLDAFNKYIGYVTDEITAAKKNVDTQYFNNKNLIEVKFEIYRTLKKIYDKWIANTDKPSKSIFQCCTTAGILGNPTRLSADTALHNQIIKNNNLPQTEELNLIDSFRFINRAFVDIGDKLPINPITITKILIESTDTSFYDFLGRILTENNLIFVPLPTYIDYSKNEEVENVFKPYPYYEFSEVTTSGPSFVCMYVGQTSTKLDFGENSDFPDDGMDLTNPNAVGDDMKLDLQNFEMPTAAFLVRYGQQNQNIFKDIVLDQSEFTETAESLKITDAIANSYSQTNQSYVGQNLYNVWSARSYKAEVTMMGNAMIQPMMYFQIDNIPMFRGAYLVTGVKHHIVPNNMSTVFTGVRIRKVATPLIDAATLYSSLLQGYPLPTGGTTTSIAQTYTNYVYKYQALLKANLPKDINIQRSAGIKTSVFDINQITTNSKTQLNNWDGGTLNETTAKGTKLIDGYLIKPNLYNFSQIIHSPSDPWSAAFVSYIMTFGDKQFPAAAGHYSYATKALDGENGYELFPLKSGLNIKVEIGDILILPRSGDFTSSHGNIVWKIENDTAHLIGGNRGLLAETTQLNAANFTSQSANKSEGTVKSTTLKLNNGLITDSTDTGLYLLIMKKTQKAYYGGKKLSITDSGAAPTSTDFGGQSTYPVKPSEVIIKEYVPVLNTVLPQLPKGVKLLLQAQTQQEGFYPANGTRPASKSYRTNNPGNVYPDGNKNGFRTLNDGIKAQWDYVLKPTYDGKSQHYKPTFTLFEYISTYAPVSDNNDPTSYTNFIINYFKHVANITITPNTTLNDIKNIT